MTQPLFRSSVRSKFLTAAVNCSLMLSAGLPLVYVQGQSSSFNTGSGAKSGSVVDNQVQEARQLELDKPIIREIAPGQSHSYQLLLDAGQYIRLVVEQRGIDVYLRLWGPDGKEITAFNFESWNRGRETLEHVAKAKGSYRLDVQPVQKGAAAGTYEIRVMEDRAATDDDRALEEARNLYLENIKLHRAGKVDDAIQVLERALDIRERVLGPDHCDVAVTAYALAATYVPRGDYQKAEELFQRSLTIYQKLLEPDHPYIAGCLDGLANIYYSKGDYGKAEPLYRKALSIYEQAQGPQYRNASVVIKSLASLYQQTGQYAKAEPLFRHALAVRERALGPEDPVVARALNDLADYYLNGDEDAEAEPIYLRALSIWEKTLGLEHINLTSALDGLAAIYGRKRDDFARAESLYQRSLAIWEKTLGPDQFHVAPPLESFARFYFEKGEYAKAEPLYRRALAIYEKSVGIEHSHVPRMLDDLAVIYAAKGDTVQAVAFLSRVNAVRERILTRNLAAGSERQKLAYLALFSRGTDFTLSLHSQAAHDDQQALNLAFTTLLRRKGRGLDAMTDTVATLRRHATPQNLSLFDRLTEARSKLASLTIKDSGATDATYQTRLKPLEEEVEKLEAELSARSAEYRAHSQPITLAAVQAALPADSALIEFSVHTPQELQTRKNKPPRYLAYLLAAQGQPRWVDLGDAITIDRAVDAWRKSLRNPYRADVKRLARALDDKVMRPVRSLLAEMPGRTRRLLIAPDGSLNLIPFAALVDEKYRYLIDRYSISYLASGGDLLRLQTSLPSKGAPLVVADPDFGRAPTITMRIDHKYRKSQERNHERTEGDRTQVFFRDLPGTRAEALAVKSVLQNASLLQRRQATEATIKQTTGPHILHIATHGFFLSDQENAAAETLAVTGDDFRQVSDLRLIKWAAQIKDPLLRSGLALAGANLGQSGDDDGLLTALEMASLDLWGTKLVVLSACDTGVGEVKNGEGVQGMRRALVLAGSESQIMSLWSVLDNGTKDLMIPYYKALRQGEGRSDGLRQVQLHMLRRKQRRHPYYWAAFILSGEWRNLGLGTRE